MIHCHCPFFPAMFIKLLHPLTLSTAGGAGWHTHAPSPCCFYSAAAAVLVICVFHNLNDKTQTTCQTFGPTLTIGHHDEKQKHKSQSEPRAAEFPWWLIERSIWSLNTYNSLATATSCTSIQSLRFDILQETTIPQGSGMTHTLVMSCRHRLNCVDSVFRWPLSTDECSLWLVVISLAWHVTLLTSGPESCCCVERFTSCWFASSSFLNAPAAKCVMHKHT